MGDGTNNQNGRDGERAARGAATARRRFTRHLPTSDAPLPPSAPASVTMRPVHGPQTEPLAPEAFAREIEAWMRDQETEASPTAPAYDDDAYGARPKREAETRRRQPHSPQRLRFETRAPDWTDDLYARSDAFDRQDDDAFEADDALDAEDDEFGEPSRAYLDAVQSNRASGGRFRAAALFAGAFVAAIAAIGYSVDQTLDRSSGEPETADVRMAAASPDVDDLNWRLAADEAPAPAPRFGEIATATVPLSERTAHSRGVSPYLNAEELAALLASRPVKCVLSEDDAKRAQMFGSANSQAFGAGGDGCETTTDYRLETGLYTRRSRLAEDATLEINAAFAVRGDLICHDLSSVAVLVLGEGLPFSKALALEEEVKDGYARRGEETVCHRIRDMSATLGKHAYRADVVVDGDYSPEQSDPRPFLMRPRF